MRMEDILVKEYTDESEDILSHHGILGQKWGILRFQNADGSYTRAGKERRRKSFRLETKEERDIRLAKKSAKQAVQQVKKAEKAAKREEKREKKSAEDAVKLERKKAQILRSGDADRIYKNQHLFSDQEINTALNRLRQNEQVRLMSKSYKREVERAEKSKQRAIERSEKQKNKNNQQNDQKQKENKKQVKTGEERVKQILGYVGTGITAYDTYKKVANAVNSITGEKTMPTFTKGGGGLKGWYEDRTSVKEKTKTEKRVEKDIKTAQANIDAKNASDRAEKAKKEADMQRRTSVVGEGNNQKSSYDGTTKFTRPTSDYVNTTSFTVNNGSTKSSSSTRSNPTIINMAFDASSGSYKSSGYDWYGSMNTPIAGLLDSGNHLTRR